MMGVVFDVVKLAYQLLVLHDSSHKCGYNGYSKCPEPFVELLNYFCNQSYICCVVGN